MSAARWNYKSYGTAPDPIHKSHLNSLTGDYGCPKQFRYSMDARAANADGVDERSTVSGKAAAGTASHETIARALDKPELLRALLAGKPITRDAVRPVLLEEFTREVGARTVQWYGEDADSYLVERVVMIAALLSDLHTYVERVLLVEPGFIAPIGKYWLSGHVDLVYVPKGLPNEIALADWKTGANKPAQIDLDHGWEAGVYSTAVCRGAFIPRHVIVGNAVDGGMYSARIGAREARHWSRYIAERNVMEAALIEIAQLCEQSKLEPSALDSLIVEQLKLECVHFGQFPEQIYHVHMRDYLPYVKAGSKAVKRPEDLRFYGYEEEQRAHRYQAGDQRGPAWLPVALTEHDIVRLESRLRNVVGMIRMGCFVDQIGDKCTRCAYSKDCLTSGYGPNADERAELERMLRDAGVSKTGEGDGSL